MNQDVNKIINTISFEWSSQLAQANKKIAVLVEENERLKSRLEESKGDEQE